MPNLDKVVHNDDLNAVTEMPPTMSDAYIDSVEADKAVEDIIKPAEEIIKEKPFLGAEKQPTPKEPEEAKITLDESLFEESDSLRDRIYDFLDELGGYADYNQKVEDVSEEFGMSPDEAEGYVWDWSIRIDPEWHDTVDQEEEEDIPLDSLKDYVDSIEVEEETIDEGCQTELTEDAHNKPDCYNDLLGYYHEAIYNNIPIIQETEEAVSGYNGDWCRADMDPQVDNAIDQLARALADAAVYYYQGPAEVDWSDETDVEFDENLNEEDKSKLSWDELGTEEAEDVDLWTLVYNSLSKERDLGASNSIKKYVTPQLSLKQRYDPINADSEGNIIVYGETEEEFNPAKEVADFHGLKYKIKESPKNWVMKHPEQKYSFTIIIPEDQLNRKLELRNPDVKRGRPKKN